ncbi:hypothetical protein [Azohydromonas australica]|uniref:hypothetical protein n=1 Tax=Azohydromonas australica TaxID=364039 RepID=UPI0003F52B12|nr:hypothetical protein [Azohydromonas australica]
MSKPNGIDFDPALFGDEPAQGPTAPLSSRAAARRRRWPLVVGLGGLVAASVAAAVSALPGSGLGHGIKARLDARDSEGVMLVDTTPVPTAFQAVASPSSSWCGEGDVLCTTVTTAHPAETLRKLVAAMPPGTGRQYRISLYLTPISEGETDDAEKPR